MRDSPQSSSVLRSAGERVGNVLAGIPPAIRDFFGGIGEGAGLHSAFDWAAMILGLALLLSSIGGLVRRRRIVGPVVSGAIGVALMTWAIT